MRITRRYLESLLDHYCRVSGTPRETWIRNVDGTISPVIGSLSLNYAACYGGYDLVRLEDQGGEHSLIGNTIFGTGRMTPREMRAFLEGMIYEAERGRGNV